MRGARSARTAPGAATVLLTAALLVAGLLLVTACGGGGGGGGGPTEPPAPSTSLTYTTAGTASGPSVVLRREGTGTDVLVLVVEARSVNNLYGLYFDLSFPSSVLSYEGATEGSFLGDDGTATTFQVAEETGNLIVGASRLGVVGGVGGSGEILTLRFRAVGSGEGGVRFRDNRGVASNGEPLDLEWIGGTVRSTR